MGCADSDLVTEGRSALSLRASRRQVDHGGARSGLHVSQHCSTLLNASLLTLHYSTPSTSMREQFFLMGTFLEMKFYLEVSNYLICHEVSIIRCVGL